MHGEAKTEVTVQIDCTQYVQEEEVRQKVEQVLERIATEPASTSVRLLLSAGVYGDSEGRTLKETVCGLGFAWLEPLAAPPAIPPAHPLQPMGAYSETTLLCRHLRSGQKIFARGNLVVLGDVNPGAEVIAGGNILVMGTLRGMAHAGRYGDGKTVIGAYRLRPTQLRISDHITRPPDEELFAASLPEIARIKDGVVVIERLKI
jgi:septum site-determining protein MinC